MYEQTETRDGKVYIYDMAPSWTKPELVTVYTETTADPSLIPNRTPVITLASGIKLAQTERREIPIHLRPDAPKIVEVAPIPKPKGRYTWHDGEWRKA